MTSELLAYDRTRNWLALIDVENHGAAAGPSQSEEKRGPSVAPERRSSGLAIRHILVPLDGSPLAECVLPVVATLANAFSARVTLLRVLEAARGPGPAPRVDALEWEISRAEALTYLSTLVTRLQRETQFPVQIEILQGKPAEQILHAAKAQQADLVALSTHGESGLNEWPVSSTAQKVIGSAHQSVLIVPARQYGERRERAVPVRKILVPLDCSQRAECILPAVTELARVHDAELILAHIVPEPELPRRVAPSSADLELAAKLTQRNRAEARRYLQEIRARLSTSPHRVRARWRSSSQPSRSLSELAEHERADLVVLSAHGSSGDPQKRYGGVVEAFVQAAKQPVIILQDLADCVGAESVTGIPVRPGH